MRKIIGYGKNTIEMKICATERIVMIVEVLNHGYGASWMLSETTEGS